MFRRDNLHTSCNRLCLTRSCAYWLDSLSTSQRCYPMGGSLSDICRGRKSRMLCIRQTTGFLRYNSLDFQQYIRTADLKGMQRSLHCKNCRKNYRNYHHNHRS
jgi:hypothetical protein